MELNQTDWFVVWVILAVIMRYCTAQMCDSPVPVSLVSPETLIHGLWNPEFPSADIPNQDNCYQPDDNGLLSLPVNFDQLYKILSIRFQRCSASENSSFVVTGIQYSQKSAGNNFMSLLKESENISVDFEDGPVELTPVVAHRLQLNISNMSISFKFDVLGCVFPSFYNEPNGSIRALDLPIPTRNSSLDFTIETKSDQYIEIKFGPFDVPLPSSIEVIDSDSRSLTGKRSGKSMSTVRSRTNRVFVILTMIENTRSGFDADYITVDIPGCTFGQKYDCSANTCYNACNSTTGMITSPNYPHRYPGHLTWDLEISVPVGSYIELDVVEFNVDVDESCSDAGDILQFTTLKIDEKDGDARMPRICPPDGAGYQITSPSNFLRVTFLTASNIRVTGNGFKLQYRTRHFVPDLKEKNIEGSCPLNWNKYNDQCYLLNSVNQSVDWQTAELNCKKHNGHLTSIRTYDEMQYIHSMLINNPEVIGKRIYIGLKREDYGRQLFRWIDGRPASYMDWYLSSIYVSGEYSSRQPGSSDVEACTNIRMKSLAETNQWRDMACSRPKSIYSICQKPVFGYENKKKVELMVPSLINSPCKDNHQFQCSTNECIAAAFVCNEFKDCFDGSDENVKLCYTKGNQSTLLCRERITPSCASLSLVCDSREDLGLGFDERGCKYATCSKKEFRCSNGKCINKNLTCNGFDDCGNNEDETTDCYLTCAPGFFKCYDGSCIPYYAVCDAAKDCAGRNYEDEDETCAYRQNKDKPNYCSNDEDICNNGACVSRRLRCLYDIDQYGIQLGCRDVTHLQNCEDFKCPDYTFKCPESYCIPMRRRCDDTFDCPNGEDEKNCTTYRCPNHYHCRRSKQCLSPLELCDGVKNCPMGDDEQFCGITCPPTCICEGFIVNCSSSILSSTDLELLPASARYLNLNGSFGQSKENKNSSVINKFFQDIIDRFHFLYILDLSWNEITLNSLQFKKLVNLRQLNLSNNNIDKLSGNPFRNLTNLNILDLSKNGLMEITNNVFKDVPNVTMLYLEENDIGDLTSEVFLNLNLTLLVSDNYKYCCIAKPKECYPREDEFSSCTDLMRATVLVVFIWILGISAFAGNICVIIWRSRTKDVNKVQGYLIQNLAISDCLMGIYLLIIATADAFYRGVYVEHSDEWKNSWICTIAGFLASFSSEMSVYILTVITIDRFICIVFPFSGFKLRPKSAAYTLATGWIVVFLITFSPILFVKGNKFYGANSVCLALPLTNQDIPAPIYSIIVFLGLNFVCLLVMGACYSTMFIVVKRSANKFKDSVNKSDNKKKELKMAIKMSLIVLTDMLCWLPIVIMGILARFGLVTIPGNVYAWTAVFVLPLNSAINPHLYTFSLYITFGKKTSTVTTDTSNTQKSKSENVQMCIVPDNVSRKRQLLPYLRESANKALTISTRLEASEGGGLKAEELSVIEAQYLKAVQKIRRSRNDECSSSVDQKPEENAEENLITCLLETSNQAFILATEGENEKTGRFEDEELASIETKYSEALGVIRRSRAKNNP